MRSSAFDGLAKGLLVTDGLGDLLGRDRGVITTLGRGLELYRGRGVLVGRNLGRKLELGRTRGISVGIVSEVIVGVAHGSELEFGSGESVGLSF